MKLLSVTLPRNIKLSDDPKLSMPAAYFRRATHDIDYDPSTQLVTLTTKGGKSLSVHVSGCVLELAPQVGCVEPSALPLPLPLKQPVQREPDRSLLDLEAVETLAMGLTPAGAVELIKDLHENRRVTKQVAREFLMKRRPVKKAPAPAPKKPKADPRPDVTAVASDEDMIKEFLEGTGGPR